MRVFCGIDWAEDHHDVALVDADGKLLGQTPHRRRRGRVRAAAAAARRRRRQRRRPDPGGDRDQPRAAGRLPARHRPARCSRSTRWPSPATATGTPWLGKKSDAGDALVLANILRTDLAAHRPLPADSELAQAIAVLARAQQDAVWERTCAHNKLRSLLREYYPGILAAFADKRDGLLRPEARALLAAAPDPRRAAQR